MRDSSQSRGTSRCPVQNLPEGSRIDGGVPARIGAFMAALTALADALYREEVARARAMDPGDKLLEGPRLFHRSYRVMADGVRHRHPELSDDEVLARVVAQLARVRALDTP
jgi:hypothetical protein